MWEWIRRSQDSFYSVNRDDLGWLVPSDFHHNLFSNCILFLPDPAISASKLISSYLERGRNYWNKDTLETISATEESEM